MQIEPSGPIGAITPLPRVSPGSYTRFAASGTVPAQGQTVTKPARSGFAATTLTTIPVAEVGMVTALPAIVTAAPCTGIVSGDDAVTRLPDRVSTRRLGVTAVNAAAD